MSDSNQPTATKADVDSVRLALRETADHADKNIESLRLNVESLRIESKTSLSALELKLQNRIDEMELRLSSGQKDLLLRLGSMIVALGGVLIAIKYFG